MENQNDNQVPVPTTPPEDNSLPITETTQPQTQPEVSQAPVVTPPTQQLTPDPPLSPGTPPPETGEAIAVPTTWPGAFAAMKLVKPAVKRVLWSIIGVFLLYYAVEIIINLALKKISIISLPIIYLLESVFIGTILSLYFAALKAEDVSVGKALSNGFSKVFTILIVTLVSGLIAIISFLLLIVPFFFIAPRFVFAPFLVINNNLGIGEALSTSWKISKGNLGKIYGLFGVELLLGLLCITIIGIPFAIYFGILNYGSIALLSMYASEQQGSPSSVAPAPTPTLAV